jgi:PAP2 superfamily
VPPLRFGDLMGLIGCPSFHGVMAVLTVRALWELPVSGPLALAANIPVMLSIPADGGHHFVDVPGGFLWRFCLPHLPMRSSGEPKLNGTRG